MEKKNLSLTIGTRINQWEIVSEFGIKNRTRHYIVKCICGQECLKNASHLRKHRECFSCSRKHQTENGGTRRTHGACSNDSDHFKTYMAWQYMKGRCAGDTPKNKKNYLDRGIEVCDRWKNSFENFLLDMGKSPENTSLDRIDNDKNYSPENCRWATITQQNDNKRGCVYHEYQGKKLTTARWAETLGITRSKAAEWIKREGIAWTIENIHKIKKCSPGMSNENYVEIGLSIRKGSGQRIHSASRNVDHPLHKMYKSWDYMKKKPMCNEWIDFMKFVEDMGQKPVDKRLRRYQISLPFSKDNCYWGI